MYEGVSDEDWKNVIVTRKDERASPKELQYGPLRGLRAQGGCAHNFGFLFSIGMGVIKFFSFYLDKYVQAKWGGTVRCMVDNC